MSFLRILFLSIAVTMLASTTEAQVEENVNLTFDQNFESPDVPKRAKEYIVKHMDQLRRELVKNGYDVKPDRNAEVLKVTIPCDELFSAGAIELKPAAMKRLSGLGLVVRDPRRYKMLVAVHTDDTGDDVYADSLSEERSNAIDDALWQIAGEKETNVIPYGMGKDAFLDKNSSREGRARNRRVEFFIIPEQGLLDLAGGKPKR